MLVVAALVVAALMLARPAAGGGAAPTHPAGQPHRAGTGAPAAPGGASEPGAAADSESLQRHRGATGTSTATVDPEVAETIRRTGGVHRNTPGFPGSDGPLPVFR